MKSEDRTSRKPCESHRNAPVCNRRKAKHSLCGLICFIVQFLPCPSYDILAVFFQNKLQYEGYRPYTAFLSIIALSEHTANRCFSRQVYMFAFLRSNSRSVWTNPAYATIRIVARLFSFPQNLISLLILFIIQ